MPARRSTGGPSSVSSTNSDDVDKEDAYRLKRQRNNDAVKKTREKSKQTANERKRHVEFLKKENIQLETKIEEQKKNVQTLKDLLLNNVKTEDQERLIKQILEEESEEEESSIS